MNIPFITVIVANYNYGQYVAGAINSALTQSYPKDRMCVCFIDDGSTDNSWQEASKALFDGKTKKDGDWLIGYKNNIKTMALRLEFNHGPSFARNRGIEKTLDFTDAYAILDADDEFYKNKIARLIGTLFSSPLLGSIYADYDVVNVETGIAIREYKEPFNRNRLTKECIVHSGSIIKKEALVQTKEENFYDEELRTCEDYDLWLRICRRYMIFHVPEPHTLVRVTPKNSTNSIDKSLWEANWLRVYNKAKSYG